MKARKGLLALLAALALCLTTALSASNPGFSKETVYGGFTDVTGRWSEAYIRTCVEYGLMEGNGGGFAPQAQLTKAEVAAIAVRIHCTLNAVALPAATQPWYQGAVDYLAGLGVSVTAPKAYATRQDFFTMLAAVTPVALLTPINTIALLPDTADKSVLAFYNAGILTGTDAFGTFHGAAPLSREECAALCARLADPSLRRHFSPAGQTPAGAIPFDGILFTVDGSPVLYREYEEQFLSLVREIQAMYLETGLHFSWDGKYGEEWDAYFRSATLHSLTAKHVATLKAAQLGCTQEELAQTLFSSATQVELEAAALLHELDLTQPDQRELATELAIENKLNLLVNQWVDAAKVVPTPLLDQIDPQAIWEALG